jgi:hypothetical protein
MAILQGLQDGERGIEGGTLLSLANSVDGRIGKT